jgi:hypothetical protein
MAAFRLTLWGWSDAENDPESWQLASWRLVRRLIELDILQPSIICLPGLTAKARIAQGLQSPTMTYQSLTITCSGHGLLLGRLGR